MPMVFISHSSEQSAGPVRQEIQHQLKQRGWEVRVDDALLGGACGRVSFTIGSQTVTPR